MCHWELNMTTPDAGIWLSTVLYRDTAEAIRWEAARSVAPDHWSSQSSLLQRLAMYEARAERAGLIASLLITDNQDDLANISEVLGVQYYQRLQNGPPLKNQRAHTLGRGEEITDAIQHCHAAYQQAASILSDEWQFPYFIGKMAAKMAAPPQEVQQPDLRPYHGHQIQLSPLGPWNICKYTLEHRNHSPPFKLWPLQPLLQQARSLPDGLAGCLKLAWRHTAPLCSLAWLWHLALA